MMPRDALALLLTIRSAVVFRHRPTHWLGSRSRVLSKMLVRRSDGGSFSRTLHRAGSHYLHDFEPTRKAKLVHINEGIRLVVDQRIPISDNRIILPTQGVPNHIWALFCSIGVGLKLVTRAYHNEVVGYPSRHATSHLVVHASRKVWIHSLLETDVARLLGRQKQSSG